MKTDKPIKVMILGTEWTIDFSAQLTRSTASCDYSTHTIHVDTTDYPLEKQGTEGWMGDMHKDLRRLVRHELIHAFAYMSGLGVNSFMHNEECVDWIANMSPRMNDVFKNVGVEE